jgi:ferredoxin
MLRILDRITAGQGREGDIELLEELSEFMEMASLCALGRTASNPVRSTIRYFRAEYESHIREKRCPAGACKALVQYEIDQEKCSHPPCGACSRACAVEAIEKVDGGSFLIVQEKCIKCGACYTACPEKFAAVCKAPAAATVWQISVPPVQSEIRA